MISFYHIITSQEKRTQFLRCKDSLSQEPEATSFLASLLSMGHLLKKRIISCRSRFFFFTVDPVLELLILRCTHTFYGLSVIWKSLPPSCVRLPLKEAVNLLESKLFPLGVVFAEEGIFSESQILFFLSCAPLKNGSLILEV